MRGRPARYDWRPGWRRPVRAPAPAGSRWRRARSGQTGTSRPARTGQMASARRAMRGRVPRARALARGATWFEAPVGAGGEGVLLQRLEREVDDIEGCPGPAEA